MRAYTFVVEVVDFNPGICGYVCFEFGIRLGFLLTHSPLAMLAFTNVSNSHIHFSLFHLAGPVVDKLVSSQKEGFRKAFASGRVRVFRKVREILFF